MADLEILARAKFDTSEGTYTARLQEELYAHREKSSFRVVFTNDKGNDMYPRVYLGMKWRDESGETMFTEAARRFFKSYSFSKKNVIINGMKWEPEPPGAVAPAHP